MTEPARTTGRRSTDTRDWDDDEPPRRLSPLRVIIAIALLAAACAGGTVAVRNHLNATPTPVQGTWFAPYVDTTLTPIYSFQNPANNTARQVVLGFVVAQPGAGCSPSWGAIGNLSDADQTVALSSRVAELAQEGAMAIVSFGGRANTDLSLACANGDALARAYQTVIDAYHLKVVDFDVEGKAIRDFAAVQRQAAAIYEIEATAAARHQPLAVWLTVPVEPTGLQDDALSLIDAMLKSRVSLRGINVMTMDFANPPGEGHSMLPQVEQAANVAERQVTEEFHRYGVELTSAAAWQHIGVTVMIGQNDVAGERFTVGDANGLASFASNVRLGRISLWSLNRDRQCGSSFAQIGVNSNTCSGTAQGMLAFSHVFSQFSGAALQSSQSSTHSDVPPSPDTNAAHAPYPSWSPTTPYPTGYKVVRQGYIFEAKWYNAGEDPMAQVQYAYQTPWDLLGPVLPTDRAPTPITEPGANYPPWSSSQLYSAGDRVVFQGLPYSAKWVNEGASPADEANDPWGSPWQPLFSIPGEPAG